MLFLSTLQEKWFRAPNSYAILYCDFKLNIHATCVLKIDSNKNVIRDQKKWRAFQNR